MTKTIKSVFAFCFSLLIISLSLMPAFAEDEPIPLSETNVVEYPTIEGTIYPTQRIGDYLTISGGKVTTDGTENGTTIAGSWEFIDPNHAPSTTGTQRSDIRFVPDDSDLYSPLEILNTPNARYTVSVPTMEIDGEMPTVDIVSNTQLRLAKELSEFKLKNAITGVEINEEYTFSWKTPLKKPTQSGYYMVTIRVGGYQALEAYVYVRVDGDQSEPPIKEFPTVEPITYREGLKASDLTIHSNVISGSIELVNPDQELRGGNNTIEMVWKPDDAEQESIPIDLFVNVEKAPASFINENGEAYVPELHYSIGEKIYFSRVSGILEYYYPANCGTFKIGSFAQMLPLDETRNYYDTSTPGTYDCIANLKSQGNINYTNTLKFKIIIDKKIVTPRITRYIDTDELIIDGLDYTDKLGGTFKVYANGELIKLTENGVKYLTRFDWRPAKSGTYKLKAEYTPADDDICAITDNVIEQDVTVALKWTVKGENVNFDSTTAQYGTNVTVLQSLGDNFNGWEFYDENDKKIANPEKELGMRYDPTVPSTVNFTMPDHDVKVKALDKTQINLPGGDGNFSDCFANFIKWLNNLASRLKALFDAIAQLLTVVG